MSSPPSSAIQTCSAEKFIDDANHLTSGPSPTPTPVDHTQTTTLQPARPRSLKIAFVEEVKPRSRPQTRQSSRTGSFSKGRAGSRRTSSEISITRDSSDNDEKDEAPLWTAMHEERLMYAQAGLKQSQRRWSESQEIWLEEVEHLIALKRQHHKTLKEQRRRQTLPSQGPASPRRPSIPFIRKATWPGRKKTTSTPEPRSLQAPSSASPDCLHHDVNNESNEDSQMRCTSSFAATATTTTTTTTTNSAPTFPPSPPLIHPSHRILSSDQHEDDIDADQKVMTQRPLLPPRRATTGLSGLVSKLRYLS